MTSSAHQDVFRFTSLRAPKTPTQEQWYRRYAKDNFLNYLENTLFTDRNLTDGAISPIGEKIFNDVYCNQFKTNEDIVNEVLELNDFGRKEKVECIGEVVITKIMALPNNNEFSFSEKEGQDIYTWFLAHNIQFTEKLDLAGRIIQTHLSNFDKQILICQLQQALKISNLSEFVLTVENVNGIFTDRAGNAAEFKNIKGKLFDRLYELYIAKRRFPVNLDHIIRQIQTLHVIEFLGYDDFFHGQKLESHSGCNPFSAWLWRLFQSRKQASVPKQHINSLLARQKNPCDISGFTAIGPFVSEPYINSKEDLQIFFSVQPLVHPIFSRLRNYHIPFNKIRPIGIADLKIVKQILVKYELGEVADIENVLKGESKERIHRRLDTIENFISDETTGETETNRETQTTDRNEMQRETQRTINEALNLNADASVHYDGGMIDATVNAGFSWDKSTEESNRSSVKFAKEIIQKSAERIMHRTQSLRTTRRTSEFEETNKHGIDNSKGGDHVIGIYRYVNKRYKAQVFNYGERMMFEFLIPEPSEFYKKAMESKNEFKVDKNTFKCTKSLIQTLEEKGVSDKNGITEQIAGAYAVLLNTSFEPYPYSGNVNKSETLFLNEGALQIQDGAYDQAEIIKGLTNQSSQRDEIIAAMKSSVDLQGAHSSGTIKTFTAALNTKIDISVNIFSSCHTGHQGNTTDTIPGYVSIRNDENSANQVLFTVSKVHDVDNKLTNFATIIANQNPILTFTAYSSWCQYYFIVVIITQTEDSAVIDAWKQKIFDDINTKVTAENTEIEAFCKEEESKFNANKKAEDEISLIKIKGKNPEINKVIINEELHKHSIALFAKEFDKDTEGDLLTDKPIGYVAEQIEKVKGASWDAAEKVCQINSADPQCKIFPVIDIDLARKKGEVVQFLEQAFEWEKISYLLYPYFYGDKSRWMETYDHFDNELNDTSFVAFLRAGYARVLVPVRDAYRDAVLQFLYSRKPWNGGSAPVIGDDLYLPIYEELRNQTDEYHDAVPEGEPWEFVLPTSLIYLQKDSSLPEYDGKFPTKK